MKGMQRVYGGLRVIREVTARVERGELGSGDFTTSVTGREEVTYDVYVYADELAAMGRRAARNRNGRCKSGPIVVKVINRRAV